MQIDLNQTFESRKCTTHISQVVVFEVKELKVGALAGKNRLISVFGIGNLNCAYLLSSHVQMGQGEKIGCVMDSRSLTSCSKKKHSCDRLSICGHLNGWQLIHWLLLYLLLICSSIFFRQIRLILVLAILVDIVPVDFNSRLNLVKQVQRLLFNAKCLQIVSCDKLE